MPVGKSSIKRAAKVTQTPEDAQKKKPETVVQPSEAAQAKEQPAVTEHVIANISPEVVERVVGDPKKKEDVNHPKDGKVSILTPMPDYLL